MRTLLCLFCIFSYCLTANSQVTVTRNFDLELVEKDSLASAKIEIALNGFLSQARDMAYTEEYVDSAHLAEFNFFFYKLGRIGQQNPAIFHAPSVLKSFSKDGETYWLTVAFTGIQDDKPFVYQITELKAVPHDGGYRFYSPFEDRAKALQTRTFNTVTYHYSNQFDENKAMAFSAFKDELTAKTKTQPQHLDYYCFESLDELLKTYGFLYSARQCNFLYYDLGFTDNEGKAFITGTQNENYLSEYVEDFIFYSLPNKNDIYWPFLTGMSMHYGGYGLSLVPVSELKKELSEAHAENADFNFLEEFKKGRRSSVNRHFCHYAISAILCEEIMETKGFDAVLSLVYSGSGGEDFYTNLHKLVDVDETNFHDYILSLVNRPSVEKMP